MKQLKHVIDLWHLLMKSKIAPGVTRPTEAVVSAPKMPRPLPPRALVDAIGGLDYEEVGNHIFELIRDRATTKPSDCILDIGCGCGRAAVPFTEYLDRTAVYEGFDIVKDMIDWCQRNITPDHPNFRFKHVSLRNTLYSEEGDDASEFVFPYQNRFFDVVFATSVFTHLLPSSARRYAGQVSRVLKKDGRGLLTFFLINDKFRKQKLAGEEIIAFDHFNGEYAVTDPKNPEAVIAFEEEVAHGMLDSAGLKIDAFSYGTWRVPGGWSFQDTFVVSPK